MAIRRLAQHKSSESSELLGAYLAGTLPDQPPNAFHCQQAVQVLEGWGDEGQDKLCEALRALNMSLRPRYAQAAKLVRRAVLDEIGISEMTYFSERYAECTKP